MKKSKLMIFLILVIIVNLALKSVLLNQYTNDFIKIVTVLVINSLIAFLILKEKEKC